MVIVNHQATGDVCTLMMCLQDKGTVSTRTRGPGVRIARSQHFSPQFLPPNVDIKTAPFDPVPFCLVLKKKKAISKSGSAGLLTWLNLPVRTQLVMSQFVLLDRMTWRRDTGERVCVRTVHIQSPARAGDTQSQARFVTLDESDHGY